MRYERVIIEAGDSTFTLDLHPRLTVIAGLARLERQSLVGEVLGALGGHRSGVHLELREDGGRQLAVFRPAAGRHRVVDVGAAADVSAEFAGPAGEVDLLRLAGLDAHGARRVLRVGAADLAAASRSDQYVRTLAAADQSELWAAADRVQRTEALLGAEAEAVGSAPEHAEVVERIEQEHQRHEAAQARQEATRRQCVLVGATAAIAAIPAVLVRPVLVLPLAAIIAATLLLAALSRRSMHRAAEAEQRALAEAGAQSYLGFHLQRVTTMLSSADHRTRLVSAADEHRQALEAWRALAGSIEVDWALEHREDVLAAALLRREVATSGQADAGGAADLLAELAHTLMGRMATARALGADGESFPLVLDDPLADLDPGLKRVLLELIGRAAGSPQLVYLTEDPDVASWARLEALTGDVALVEPAAPATSATPTIDLSTRSA